MREKAKRQRGGQVDRWTGGQVDRREAERRGLFSSFMWGVSSSAPYFFWRPWSPLEYLFHCALFTRWWSRACGLPPSLSSRLSSPLLSSLSLSLSKVFASRTHLCSLSPPLHPRLRPTATPPPPPPHIVVLVILFALFAMMMELSNCYPSSFTPSR